MANGSIPARRNKQVANLRQYESIWLAIRAKQPGEVTQIRCHPDAVARIIQAVRKEKTKTVSVRRKLSILTAGPLITTFNPEVVDGKLTGFMLISFSLSYDGSKL